MKRFRIDEPLNHGGSDTIATHPAFFPTIMVTAKQMSNVYAGAGSKNFLIAWHAATAKRNAMLRRVWFNVVSNAAAALVDFEVFRIDDVPTGHTSVTPNPVWKGQPALETSAGKLSTGGATTEGIALGVVTLNLGIITAETGIPRSPVIDVFKADPSSGAAPLIARAGALEGWVLQVTSSAITTLVISAGMEISELPN